MTIRKKGSKFQLISGTGKNLGTFDTKEQAQKREKQVKFFKNTKKADGTPIHLEQAKETKRALLAGEYQKQYDMNDDAQRELASCMYIAMEELERKDRLNRIARASDKTLEDIMAAAKPALDDGTPVDLASGAATTEMLVIERKRTGLETGNPGDETLTGNTNEHDHSYDPSIAGFTSPDPHDGHMHWVDIRMESTSQGGMAHHVHTTQTFDVQRDDLIVFEEGKIVRRSEFGGLVLSEKDSGGVDYEFDGIFTGVERAGHLDEQMGDKKKKPFEKIKKAGEMDNPGSTGLPLTTRQRAQGSILANLSARETRERADRAESKKKRRITGQERLFGKLDPDAQDVALLPPDKQ
jgi:hypothetical protein